MDIKPYFFIENQFMFVKSAQVERPSHGLSTFFCSRADKPLDIEAWAKLQAWSSRLSPLKQGLGVQIWLSRNFVCFEMALYDPEQGIVWFFYYKVYDSFFLRKNF